MVYLLVFHVCVNEMHGLRGKIPSKKLIRQLCAEGFNSGVKGLREGFNILSPGVERSHGLANLPSKGQGPVVN
jgi:hypothetical protein